MSNSHIVRGWLVIALCLVFGGALAGVEMALRDRIAANRLAETLEQIPRLVPGAGTGRADTLAGKIVYRALDKERQVGWVVPASGQGFADQIILLAGVDLEGRTLTGLYVLEQKETPGLGNKIQSPEWRKQFAGKSVLEPLAVSRTRSASAREIDAITGATISAEAVCQILNQTLGGLRAALQARAGVER